MEKPLKTCPYCGRDVKGLGLHIINAHPKIMEQLDEMAPITPPPSPNLAQNPGLPQQNRAPVQDLNSMIREKLDTMLNIKIIEMLSKNDNVTIKEISEAINPPQKTTLQEIKEYHDLVYGEKDREIPETGNQWIDLATAAIPMVRDMIQAKKGGVKNDESGSNEERSIRILQPISEEIAGDRSESGGISQKPGDPGAPKQ